jgi:hypothetical protein
MYARKQPLLLCVLCGLSRHPYPQSTQKVATAIFSHTFHHDGKVSPAWWGWECTPTPFYYIYHHLKSCGIRSSWEGRYTPPISTLPIYVLYVSTLVLSACFPNCDQMVHKQILYMSSMLYSILPGETVWKFCTDSHKFDFFSSVTAVAHEWSFKKTRKYSFLGSLLSQTTVCLSEAKIL